MCIRACSVVLSSATPWTAACQALLSMEFSKQEYWGELPFVSSGDLPDPGIEPVSPAWEADSLPLSHQGNLASIQFSSVSQSCPTLCDPMNRSTPDLPVHHQLPESTQTLVIELVMPSNHLILSCPLLLLLSVFPSIRVFSNESVLCIRCQSIGALAPVLPVNIQG